MKPEKKAKKSKHRGSLSGGVKKFLLDITGINFGKKFLNVCSRLAGKGFCGIGKFMYNTKGQFLGSLQFAGGVIQLTAAIGLCSTGAGAILGIPMMLHREEAFILMQSLERKFFRKPTLWRKHSGVIPRTNVLTNGKEGYIKQANKDDYYVEFDVDSSLLVTKNEELGQCHLVS